MLDESLSKNIGAEYILLRDNDLRGKTLLGVKYVHNRMKHEIEKAIGTVSKF
jgi:hypothetical protein